MYIWGGGWDAAKMGNARRIGMDKDWGDFAKQQTSDYDFEEYLNYYGGWGDIFGYETGNKVSPTPYIEAVIVDKNTL